MSELLESGIFELLESGIFDEGSSDYESFVLFASESSPTQSVFWVPRSEQEDTGNGFMIVVDAASPRIAPGTVLEPEVIGGIRAVAMHPADWEDRECYHWPEGWRMDLVELTSPRTRRAIPQEPGGFRMDLLFDPFRKQDEPPSKETVARLLAFEHAEDSADTLAIFWLKTADEKTIWLIEVISSAGGEEVLPFRFTPDPPDVPFHMGLILLPVSAWGEDILTARGEGLNWPTELHPATHEVELLFLRAPAPQET